MLEQLTAWTPQVRISGAIELDDLSISFERTIRVPDTCVTCQLPPTLGAFPLFKTSEYADKLPARMAQKGGLFMPMHEREAMWIRFRSQQKYAIKIYVGNVNVISGAPVVPTIASTSRRLGRLVRGESIQDYVVTPHQHWLDGMAMGQGRIRQFVAMPMESGYSVEAQMAAEELVGGLQFDITRFDPPACKPADGCSKINIMVQTLTGKYTAVSLSKHETLGHLKVWFECRDGLLPQWQRWIFGGRVLQDDEKPLGDYGIQEGSTLRLVSRLRGGADGAEIRMAAGGLVKQAIVELPKRKYQKTTTVTLNVQILNSASFQQMTGQAAPPMPISAQTYASSGLPFFALYEKPTTIAGDFAALQSIAQMDGIREMSLPNSPLVLIQKAGLLNSNGPKGEFRFAWEVIEELASWIIDSP